MVTIASADRSVLRKQVEVLAVAEGFLKSAVLFALVKLGVFGRLGDGTATAHALARDLEAHPAALTRLLDAGVALHILEAAEGGAYGIASPFREVLAPSAGDHSLLSWLENLDFLRDAVSRLDQAARTGQPTVDPSQLLKTDPKAVRDFTLAMHDYASVRGRELARFLDTSGCRTLLDLGAGPGTYAFHLGARNPNLELFLLDLPEVLKVARDVATRYALANSIHYLPQDAIHDAIPGSYDLVLVSNTLHMLGERQSRLLLDRLYAALNPGGSLVVQAQFLDADRQGPRWPAMLDLFQLCITPEGRNHTMEETTVWLEAAGFTAIETCHMSLVNTNSYLRAHRS